MEKTFTRGRGFFEKAHVLVDIFGVGKNAGRASDVAEDRFGSGNSFAGGKIVDERRGEVRLRGVLENLVGVGLIDGLFGIAAGLGFAVGKGISSRRKGSDGEQGDSQTGWAAHENSFEQVNPRF